MFGSKCKAGSLSGWREKACFVALPAHRFVRSRLKVKGSCPQADDGAVSLRMGRRRKGSGDQRSRWIQREVSFDPNSPQAEADLDKEGGNRHAKIEALAKNRQTGLIVVLEDPADMHNAGAVLRSCDAFGATEAWFIHNGIEEGTSMRPHVERREGFDTDSYALQASSSSASRWVATRTFWSTSDALKALEEEGYGNVATCFTPESKSLYESELTWDKVALWVGNEFAGLSDAAIAAANTQLFIPMRGMIQSLNLSVATAVCLNEISRQRSAANGGERWRTSEEEQRRIAAALAMKRRGFRDAVTGDKSKRLEKTWKYLVAKSNPPPTTKHD
eukprot:CAMPEP_0202829704 /NCGR_PEP_ID=MMETSP1389-20130828/15689_1 /ASSEMBLY_ACC=CAM_ASM_000865 /TAXON_ID=302021 /ORGANISM="Rhodomonas sp., Strain CCMP768" /LENGTH=331 /DNA_ID=CAMNT_0049503289 /DNA_START=34 /DNA_END=1029 /DNA_ORIENTATION=+